MDWGQLLVGDWHRVAGAAVKAVLLFLVAALAFRVGQRRTLAELAPFDWVAAVAVGAIVGRTATASDASFLTGTAALVALLAAHAVVARLRLVGRFAQLVDPPLVVLVRDGVVDQANLHRSGLLRADLDAILREHGHADPSTVALAVLESKGAVSVLGPAPAPEPAARPPGLRTPPPAGP